MKKLLILLTIFFMVGCSSANNSVKKSDVEGYWLQIERDWSGDVTDMTNNPYAYLEITKDRLFFYTESSMNKGYYDTVASKYYILEDDKLYYDYEELKGNDWKENIGDYGGTFIVSFDGNNLVLKRFYSEYEEDGYEKNTYIRVKDEDKLLNPQPN